MASKAAKNVKVGDRIRVLINRKPQGVFVTEIREDDGDLLMAVEQRAGGKVVDSFVECFRPDDILLVVSAR